MLRSETHACLDPNSLPNGPSESAGDKDSDSGGLCIKGFKGKVIPYCPRGSIAGGGVTCQTSCRPHDGVSSDGPT